MISRKSHDLPLRGEKWEPSPLRKLSSTLFHLHALVFRIKKTAW